MKISFDLDDTLIPSAETIFRTEPRNFMQRLTGVEKIRYKTRELFKHLKENGHTVGIYTTSFRPGFKLRLHFLTYGIFPDFIITEKANRSALFKLQIYCSKYPPAFNIDWHIDDLLGVEREGQLHNFKTIIVNKADDNWSDKIKKQLR